MLVGQLLNLGLGAALVILGDCLVLEQFLDVVVRIPADIANRNLGLLALVVNHLGKLSAPFFGQRRQRHPDHGARACRVQSQVGSHDRLLDLADHGLVPGRDRQRP